MVVQSFYTHNDLNDSIQYLHMESFEDWIENQIWRDVGRYTILFARQITKIRNKSVMLSKLFSGIGVGKLFYLQEKL
jgi:hypothetical protein